MSPELGRRHKFEQSRRWVIKVGSALLTDTRSGLNIKLIEALAAQIAQLRRQGREVVVVSSGAVASGMAKLGWSRRPHALHELQAVAAVGQMSLIQSYETAFLEHDLHTAQVLLSHVDISARDRYLNARHTLTTLLELGVVPVVNENDSVVTEEIRFGDNDMLSALVANLLDADALLILTDQDGMFEADPRQDSEARLIESVAVDDPGLDAMAGDGGELGRGGMLSKLRAARLAARSGTDTMIAHGKLPGVVVAAAAGAEVGTWLQARQAPLKARKQWLAGLLCAAGALVLDDGAARVLTRSGKSLLPVGVREVRGSFNRGDMVICQDALGREVARGLVNYSSADAGKIIGKNSSAIEAQLGYQGDPELIHRDNLVLAGSR